MSDHIRGFTCDRAATLPVSTACFDRSKKVVFFSRESAQSLRMAGEAGAGQTDGFFDFWYENTEKNAHLAHYFAYNGQTSTNSPRAVRKGLGQWALDLCRRFFDQNWPNYPHEIALRRRRSGQDQTGGVQAVFRFPVMLFLAKKGILPSRRRLI